MIEFKGNLSEAGRKIIVHQNQVMCLIGGIIGAVPFMALFIALAIEEEPLLWITVPCFLLFIVMSYVMKPTGKILEKMMTNLVVINDRTVVCESEADYKETEIEDIKKIIDYGDFYRIVFYFPNLNARFICQKDLITQGSIEEFEERFSDKIIRKPLKYK